MMTDTIADFLIRIKNGYLAHKNEVLIPASKMKKSLAHLLQKEGWIGQVTQEKTNHRNNIKIRLVYHDGKSQITQIVKVSKPGMKVYAGKSKIPKVLGGLGMTVLSTPQGLMTGKEARKKKIGGEVICKIW